MQKQQVRKSCNSVLNCGTSTNNSASQVNSPKIQETSYMSLSIEKKNAVICYAIMSACIHIAEIDEEEYDKVYNSSTTNNNNEKIKEQEDKFQDCTVSKIKLLKRETIKYLSNKSKCLDTLQEKYYKRLQEVDDDASKKFNNLVKDIDFINNILVPSAWLSLIEPASMNTPVFDPFIEDDLDNEWDFNDT